MHPETEGQQEYLRNAVEAPVTESLLDPFRAEQILPLEIVHSETFKEQVAERKILNERLDHIVAQLPRADVSLEDAIQQGNVTESQVADLYQSLSHLLEDPDYQRMALYLPFEFLPRQGWQPQDETLKNAKDHFSDAYMNSWERLLGFHDVRENFNVGDLVEAEQYEDDLPRVVKAAHLIPKLVEKGMMDFESVIDRMERTDDTLLKHSIADTLPVLADMGLIQSQERERMERSGDEFVSALAGNMESLKTIPAREKLLEEIASSAIQQKVQDRFSVIDQQSYKDITPKREQWLRQEAKQKVVDQLADEIANALQENQIDSGVVTDILRSEDYTVATIGIEGLRKLLETTAQHDGALSKQRYAEYQNVLRDRWNTTPELRNTLVKTFRRLSNAHVVDASQLTDLGIPLPKLEGPFSENLQYIQEQVTEVRVMAASLASHPELSRLTYPVVLMNGSALKGYTESGADMDLSVFVRPDVDPSERDRVRALLKEIFPHEKVQGEVNDVWLEQNTDHLRLRSVETDQGKLDEVSEAQIILGAAWEGDASSASVLKKKLLPSFMIESGHTIHGQSARRLYLGEIERDVLQYRLMHKGYERLYPRIGGLNAPHAENVDGESVFWDSGYRRLATQLFARRVFLPKIPETTPAVA